MSNQTTWATRPDLDGGQLQHHDTEGEAMRHFAELCQRDDAHHVTVIVSVMGRRTAVMSVNRVADQQGRLSPKAFVAHCSNCGHEVWRLPNPSGWGREPDMVSLVCNGSSDSGPCGPTREASA